MAALLALLIGQQLLPERETSEMENRVLSSRPQFSIAAVSGSGWADSFEAYAADQLPGRDLFVSVYTSMNALTGHRLIESVLLGRDGWMFDTQEGWSQRTLGGNADALRQIEEASGKPVFLLALPTASAVYRDLLPSGVSLADESEWLTMVGEETRLIPLLPALREKAREGAQLYYRTDHHWTVEGAWLGYEAVCEALGLSSLPAIDPDTYEGFYGSFYARCPLPWIKPDVFSWMPVEGVVLTADGQTYDGLIDHETLSGRDLYAALLYGNHGYMELTNENAEGGALFVIKDSYANAMLPLLARHYKKIVAIDARYYAGDVIEAIQKSEGDSVLCVCSVSSLASSRALSLLEGL